MNRRNATLGVATIGVVAGAVGLGFLAAPAGAGQSPTLPSTTPAALVQSVLTASPPAMAGTVEIDNNLGLPAIPGLPAQLAGGTSQVRVWTDGTGRTRLSIPAPASEETLVNDGTTLYDWNSSNRTVTEHHVGGSADKKKAPAGTSKSDLNPATAAKAVVAAVQQISTISVDGTDLVANRPAYDLVLTPKANQRTLLRQVRIAVDAQTHVPLRLTVLANNTDTPAIQVGFSSLNVGAQDPSLFRFTPPAGATVTNGDKADQNSATMAGRTAPTIVGKGWETVLVTQVPTTASGQSGQSDKSGSSMLGLVREFGKPVSGTWGSGWLVSTNVGNAIITSDGRVAAGFVPQQLLTNALGSTK
ncbi:MAG TPA: outer membrane lipoprotein carrier protein LolA [Pseudonocardiaceae bacterium]